MDYSCHVLRSGLLGIVVHLPATYIYFILYIYFVQYLSSCHENCKILYISIGVLHTGVVCGRSLVLQSSEHAE